MEDAKEAMKSCNNTEFEGRTIRLEFSQSREERGGGGRGNSGVFYFLYCVLDISNVIFITTNCLVCS